jgi:hypothetical protein
MADGDALHVTRTKAFSAVGIQKTLGKRLTQSFFQYFYQNRKGWKPEMGLPAFLATQELLEFGFRASFELFLAASASAWNDSDGLRAPSTKSWLRGQTGQFANGFDDRHLFAPTSSRTTLNSALFNSSSTSAPPAAEQPAAALAKFSDGFHQFVESEDRRYPARSKCVFIECHFDFLKGALPLRFWVAGATELRHHIAAAFLRRQRGQHNGRTRHGRHQQATQHSQQHILKECWPVA